MKFAAHNAKPTGCHSLCPSAPATYFHYILFSMCLPIAYLTYTSRELVEATV